MANYESLEVVRALSATEVNRLTSAQLKSAYVITYAHTAIFLGGAVLAGRFICLHHLVASSIIDTL